MSFLDRTAAMDALINAVPHLRLYRERTFVLKVGGAICADSKSLRDVAVQIGVLREFGIRIVLVHGGGPQTTRLADKLGIPTNFVEGRRITCERTLDVAVMTMGGAVNTSILSAFLAENVPAVGLTGLDAGLIRAVRRPVQTKEVNGESVTIDYGLVGDVVGVNSKILETLLAAQFIPVISSLSADETGQVLNINADTIAATLAKHLRAAKLIFLTDTPGLLENKNDPSSLISYTDVQGISEFRSRGVIDSGMLPKVNSSVDALENGVERVHMVGYRPRGNLLTEIFTNEGAGTLIVKNARESAVAEVEKVK